MLGPFVLFLVACDDPSGGGAVDADPVVIDTGDAGESTPDSDTDTDTDTDTDPPSRDTSDSGGTAEWTLPDDYRTLCEVEPPPGAAQPAPPAAYSGGTCPTLVPGSNTLVSGGTERQFLLVMPEELGDDELLPLAVLWHPLATDADVYLEQGELETAIDEQRFVAVIPEDKGDLYLQWPWTIWDPDSRVDEELVFFDDILACVMEQLPINRQCVGNAGVSSGGIWADQVAWLRGEHLSSQISISGGVGVPGDWLVREWGGSAHAMPTLNLWGGESDQCYLFEFTPLARQFGEDVTADGHAVIECIHNCGHALPPNDRPDASSQFELFWQFFLDHPFWLEDGETPYAEGLPESFPDWCSVGHGTATERTGACEMENQCEGLDF